MSACALSLQISSFANQMVRILSEVEMNAVSIERCREYTEIKLEVSIRDRLVFYCSLLSDQHFLN